MKKKECVNHPSDLDQKTNILTDSSLQSPEILSTGKRVALSGKQLIWQFVNVNHGTGKSVWLEFRAERTHLVPGLGGREGKVIAHRGSDYPISQSYYSQSRLSYVTTGLHWSNMQNVFKIGYWTILTKNVWEKHIHQMFKCEYTIILREIFN